MACCESWGQGVKTVGGQEPGLKWEDLPQSCSTESEESETRSSQLARTLSLATERKTEEAGHTVRNGGADC